MTSSYGESRKGHNVFTEQGVYMLSTILKSDVAANTTIMIIEGFIGMKNYIGTNIIKNKYLNENSNRLTNYETLVKSSRKNKYRRQNI